LRTWPSLTSEDKLRCEPDGYVRIWSMEAIYNASISKYAKPKQLAALSPHSGTIHTVRFSGNNKYLASGADDKIVCVYWLDPNPPSHAAFGMYPWMLHTNAHKANAPCQEPMKLLQSRTGEYSAASSVTRTMSKISPGHTIRRYSCRSVLTPEWWCGRAIVLKS